MPEDQVGYHGMAEKIAALTEENLALKSLLRPTTKFDPRWELGEQEERLLALLAQRGHITHEQGAVCIGRDVAAVYGTMFRLRVKMRKHRIEIQNLRGVGYAVRHEDMARLRAAIVSALDVEN